MIHKTWARRSLTASIVTLAILSFASMTLAQSTKPKIPPILEQRIGEYPAVEFDADRSAYKASDDLKKKQEIRNDVGFRSMATVDYRYGTFKGDLFNGNAKKNFFLDLGESAAVAAIGLTNVLSTKDALTAGLQFLRGGRAAYNKNFLNSLGIPMLINSMDAARLAKRTEIENKLASMGPTEYPLDALLLDVLEYYYEGTLTSAIQHLTENAGTALQNARSEASAARAQRAVRQ